MDSSLQEVWQAAAGSPFLPTVGKGSQFLVGFVLLANGLVGTGVFALSMHSYCGHWRKVLGLICADRSLANLTILGIPSSLAIAYVPSTSNERPCALKTDQPQIRSRLYVLCSRSLRLRYPDPRARRPDTCTLVGDEKEAPPSPLSFDF